MQRGNWTQVPNEVFDVLMKDLTWAELKILLTLIRLTTGFQKPRDQVTYNQLEKRTGLARGSIATALKSLQAKNLISKNSWGYAVNQAQIVQPLDSLGSKSKIVQPLDSTVQPLDSNSTTSELYNRAQIVQPLDSTKDQRNTLKETPPTKEVERPVPGWEKDVEGLVGLGVDLSTAIKLSETAQEHGREPGYISDITGYVALPSTAANNPARMAIALIRRNDSRSPETTLNGLQTPTTAGKSSKGPIDWSDPKYQHGGRYHWMVSSDCEICRKGGD